MDTNKIPIDPGADCCAAPGPSPVQSPRPKGLWSLLVAVVVGFLASACCVLPLLLIVAGIGGAWMANLRVLDPYAPYLDVVVLLFLGYAHVQNYREKRAIACGTCSPTSRLGRWKTPLLWTGTIFVLLMLAIPHILPRLLLS
ncbi:mercury transporter MerT [Acidithiobacillus caldus]|jgi:mercuric ion transport protein|nr:mercuric transporter MerT family protein [Acidithiobacillus caldus]AUW32390.1 mercury transporter MerT [Acidithiobacillus caldus]MBU2782764.1 mercury transporter MerT [Acidithiobacillus caldus]MBU2791209.1 mercury transporter MerT [Acidithiobacillus caldus]MBU2820998.1 mercury transporter MerT [Acidithiobacillus caldus]OFC29977.1 mercury transporter MerT [Acidithiobacillus caldus]